GLGLAIARQFIEMHGGRIWVESEPGRGATFWIALPFGPDRR
ncbi:MAG: PAS domain-containing sensor histidine kinase, partial [Gammaproteobacteria bacterium]|nr:PAS domain-containing sensor histidine kinase [Gammaproteobacteria bacterium]